MESEARARLVNLLKGVDRYLSLPEPAPLPPPPILWQMGSARLLEYSAADTHAPAILFIPSLINRYHVLDLAPARSAARWLAGKGLRCFILDWGAPSGEEQAYDCAQYVTHRLLPAVQAAVNASNDSVILAGYCMGGLLALAAAQRVPHQVKALALLATPWDFHSKDSPYTRLDETHTALLEQLIARQPTLPPHVMHALFASLNPFAFDTKFQRFAEGLGSSEEEDIFLRLERWVNDGVPLSQGVAGDCLIHFAQHNITARGEWRVGGERIDPSCLPHPAFIANPRADKIVPPGCAAPLEQLLQKPTVIRPSGGHVGMVAGSEAMAQLWHPLAEWAFAA